MQTKIIISTFDYFRTFVSTESLR